MQFATEGSESDWSLSAWGERLEETQAVSKPEGLAILRYF